MVQPLWKMVWKFLSKLSIYLPYDSAIPLSGIYQREVKTYAHTKSCTQMFLVAVFIVAKNWNLEKKYVLQLVMNFLKCYKYIQWNTAIKRNELLTHATKQMSCKSIRLKRNWQFFSVKGQHGILGFTEHKASVTTTQFCHSSVKQPCTHGCVLIKLYILSSRPDMVHMQ